MTRALLVLALISKGPLSMRRCRYLLVAGVCAASHNAIMILGDRAGGSYPMMIFTSFITLTPTAYILHTRFTFAERFSASRLLRYFSGAAIGLPLSLLAMATLCTGFGLPVFVAAPIATVMLFIWNWASAHLSIVGRYRWG